MDVLYTKYNYHRLPQFQVATSIFLEKGQKRVVKRALTPQAASHIARMHQGHALFFEYAVGDVLQLPAIHEKDDTSIVYDFIEGPSLDFMLFQAFLDRNPHRFLQLIDEYMERLRTCFKTVSQPQAGGQADIEQVFGRSEFGFLTGAKEPYLALSAVDLIFDNIIVRDDRYYLIDNEWVFPGCLPVTYVLYRALFEFYELKCRDFGIERFVPFQAVAQRYGMDNRTVGIYRDMEEHFQTYVCGEQRLNFNLRYLKAVETIPHMQEEMVRQQNLIQIQESEIQRLRGKERELTLIVNSRGYRLLRAVCRTIDRLLPPGTRRRRWVGSVFHGVLAVGQSKNLLNRSGHRGAQRKEMP